MKIRWLVLTVLLFFLACPLSLQAQEIEVPPETLQILQQRYPAYTITDITLQGEYLMANWRDQHGGGNLLWQLQDHQWSSLAEGGGAMSLYSLTSRGIPEAEARALLERFNPEILHVLP